MYPEHSGRAFSIALMIYSDFTSHIEKCWLVGNLRANLKYSSQDFFSQPRSGALPRVTPLSEDESHELTELGHNPTRLGQASRVKEGRSRGCCRDEELNGPAVRHVLTLRAF